MHLSLTNFLCHDKLELDFPLKSIVLIKGERGKGKSSCIKAIAWVLYGNIKKVTPFKAPNVKTTVTLVMDNLTVTRTKKPNRLAVIQNNITYENQEAQKKIENLFGTYDIWLATSYVMQKKENLFLTTSNAEKMDILNTIAFHDELPSVYINKIEKALDKHKHLQEIKLGLFNKKLSQFNEEDLQLLSNILEDPEDVHKSLIVAKETLNNLLTIKKQRDIAIAIRSNKEEELHQLRNELIQLDITYNNDDDEQINKIIACPTKEGIMYIDTLIAKLSTMDAQMKRKHELSALLNNIGEVVDATFNEDDYIKAKKQEEQYHLNDNILKLYELDHDEEQINDCIDYFRTILASQETLVLTGQLQLEQEHLKNCKNKLDVIDKKLKLLETQHISSMIDHNKVLKDSLSDYEQQLKNFNIKMECPHCNGELLYQQGKLVIFETHYNNEEIEDNIQRIKNVLQENVVKINKYNEEYDTTSKNKQVLDAQLLNFDINIKTIENKLSLLPEAVYFKVLTNEEKEKTYESINKLKTISLTSLPAVSSTIINNTIKYKLYKDELALLPEACSNNQDTITLITLLQKLKIKLNKSIVLQENINKIELQISNIVVVNDPEPQITVVQNNINYFETSLINHKRAQKVLKEHDILKEDRNEVLQLTQKVEDLTTLKQYAIDIECKVLGDIVAGINTSLHAICTSLFDDLILELCLFKTLKNKNEDTKPCVHFTVYYKGCVYDNVNSLSGGELDQVSLAIAIAFHKLLPNPFIMYDEISANLNCEHKNMNIAAIKEHIDCTVLYIQHDGTDGVFDHVIDIGNYT
jgi:energy-coupling factor transporter ATP-binding protein EcfA2